MTASPRDASPVSATAPPLLRRPFVRQHWGGLAFAHWRVEPERVAPLLPPGTRPDVHDGSTWVGLIPFRLSGSAFGPLPAVPWAGSFLETNVRLYSVDDLGRRGVVFRTLEAQKLLPVLGAQAGLGLPYRWASMTRRERGGVVEYASRRHGPGARPSSRLAVRPLADEVVGVPLADFLTGRWGMHVAAADAPATGRTSMRRGPCAAPSSSTSTTSSSPTRACPASPTARRTRCSGRTGSTRCSHPRAAGGSYLLAEDRRA